MSRVWPAFAPFCSAASASAVLNFGRTGLYSPHADYAQAVNINTHPRTNNSLLQVIVGGYDLGHIASVPVIFLLRYYSCSSGLTSHDKVWFFSVQPAFLAPGPHGPHHPSPSTSHHPHAHGMNGHEHLSCTRCVILLFVCIGIFGLMCAVRVEGRISQPRYRARPDGSPSISELLGASEPNQLHHPNPWSRKRSRPKSRMICGLNNALQFTEQEFWIRNACKEGFLAIFGHRSKARVVAQLGGLTKHSPEVKFIKQTFKCPGDGIQDPVQTRLFHPDTGKYVCFNRRGRVRAVSKARANRMGTLCSFYEVSVEVDHAASTSHEEEDHAHDEEGDEESSPSTSSKRHRFVQFQSVHSRQRRDQPWLLGFNQKLKRAKRTQDGHLVSLPRPMLRRSQGSLVPRNIREDSCEFKFVTGKFSSLPEPSLNWSGVLTQMQRHQKLRARRRSRRGRERTASTRKPLGILQTNMKKKIYDERVNTNDEPANGEEAITSPSPPARARIMGPKPPHHQQLSL
eukprot:maker-scaffold261_size233860-snap-gene-1.32 protein:Tk10692 transcript:maker-scaffold261_size233860-snap-gene-1.32-mRNA-1 annotation:"centrosomal protein of 63 kda-like isoform 1"